MIKKNSLQIFIVLLFLILLIPWLVQRGMFLDGITYAAVSKNMANGIGSFWVPQYTATLYSQFYEHPPLVFIIQSCFFRLLGDGFLTERIFTLVNSLATAILLMLNWRLLNENWRLKNLGYLTILFWITIPIVYWSYRNNMLENSVAVWSLLSVFFMVKSLKENKIAFLILGSIFVIAGFLSKGLVALFPLGIPLFYGAVYNYKKWHLYILHFILLVFISLLIFWTLIYVFPELGETLLYYFNQQLIPALMNEREITVNSRFAILWKLLFELLILLVVIGFIVFFRYRRKGNLKIFKNKEAAFYFLVAISASVPLIISLKQRKFYLVPAIPFYVLAFVSLMRPVFVLLEKKYKEKLITYIYPINFLLFVVLLVISTISYGKYSRDKELIEDVQMISEEVGENSILSTSFKNYANWGLGAYLSRENNISLSDRKLYYYYLLDKSEEVPQILSNRYTKIDLNLHNYQLFEKTETP